MINPNSDFVDKDRFANIWGWEEVTNPTNCPSCGMDCDMFEKEGVYKLVCTCGYEGVE